ncbi:MAG: aldehyde dehydrogenase family protein [Leptolyngbya sp. Prado105]|jgi:acetaldehyde dehydrogenase (acetylating)|nr:aldehyde dehydrogenase family protein [Leptolyngbya sp. Prado105]
MTLIQLERDLYSIQEARSLLNQAHLAQQVLQKLSQTQIDQIVEAMVEAGYEAREQLAKLAVAETGFGKWQDKVIKNAVSTRHLQAHIRLMKTCGIIDKQHEGKIWKVATPMGIVAAIIPSTNPTSTMMYKAIIAIKSRNAIVASPHPRATKCTRLAAQILQEAAEEAGAPKDAVQCLSIPTRQGTTELMQHELTKVILATGGERIVKSAYSSGKPAYGVGAGTIGGSITTDNITPMNLLNIKRIGFEVNPVNDENGDRIVPVNAIAFGQIA